MPLARRTSLTGSPAARSPAPPSGLRSIAGGSDPADASGEARNLVRTLPAALPAADVLESSGYRLSEQHSGRLMRAEELYGIKLSTAQLERHRENTVKVAQKLEAFIAGLPEHMADCEVPHALAPHVFRLLNEAGFDASAYVPRDPNNLRGYGKYLLFSTDNGDLPFCLQVFAFGPGQKTPAHDHPCACASIMFEGQVYEQPWDDHDGVAIRQGPPVLRTPGSVSILDPDQPNIHSIENPFGAIAISVHLYLIDGVKKPAAVKHLFKRRSHEALDLTA